MKRITRIGVLSLGKVLGLAGAIVGAICLVPYGLIVIAIGLGGGMEGAGGLGVGIGLAMMLLGPIFYGLITFVFGLLYAVVLNFAFRRVGGLELEIE